MICSIYLHIPCAQQATSAPRRCRTSELVWNASLRKIDSQSFRLRKPTFPPFRCFPAANLIAYATTRIDAIRRRVRRSRVASLHPRALSRRNRARSVAVGSRHDIIFRRVHRWNRTVANTRKMQSRSLHRGEFFLLRNTHSLYHTVPAFGATLVLPSS